MSLILSVQILRLLEIDRKANQMQALVFTCLSVTTAAAQLLLMTLKMVL